jgi:hypothetical protein
MRSVRVDSLYPPFHFMRFPAKVHFLLGDCDLAELVNHPWLLSPLPLAAVEISGYHIGSLSFLLDISQ